LCPSTIGHGKGNPHCVIEGGWVYTGRVGALSGASVGSESAGTPFPRKPDEKRYLTLPSRADEFGESRWHAIGLIAEVVVLVAHTIREEAEDEIVRVVSARRATRQERKRYEKTRIQDVG